MATPKNVYELAQERLDVIFREFDTICVSFSGGKDSGVLLNLCIDYIRRNRLNRKLCVFHMDYEIQYSMTIDYVDRVLEANKDILEVYRVCVPFRVTTQGLQYQFGRKDPFTTSLDYDEEVAVFLRNVRSDSLPHLFSYEEPLTIAQAIGKPDVFIHRMNLSGGKWCETSEMKYLWGNPEGQVEYFPSLTVKTIYDPCPIGYKVPPVDALILKMKSYSQYEHGGIYYAGEEGDNTKLINMPAVHSAYYAYGTSIAYWTSSDFGKPNSTFEWGEFGFMHTYYPGSYTLRYNAFARPGSIRCVKE